MSIQIDLETREQGVSVYLVSLDSGITIVIISMLLMKLRALVNIWST
nr:MAG TPA: hypothetical protein [Caudoviricetes sp.]